MKKPVAAWRFLVELADVVRVQLPEDVGERYIVVIRKSYNSDEYPRQEFPEESLVKYSKHRRIN